MGEWFGDWFRAFGPTIASRSRVSRPRRGCRLPVRHLWRQRAGERRRGPATNAYLYRVADGKITRVAALSSRTIRPSRRPRCRSGREPKPTRLPRRFPAVHVTRPMKIGVPKETAEGERRVALVPDVVKALTAKEVEVAVEAGAGEGASHPDSEYTDAGAKVGDDVWGADVVLKVTPPTDEEVGRLKQGQVLIGFLEPLTNPALAKSLAERRGHQLRDGGDPADHARPVDGRALLAGQPRRLHVGADRRARVRQALPDDDHGRRHHPAGQGPDPRRRRRRPAGDRHRQAPRRRRHRLRRPLGGQGAGPVARRPLPRGRGGQGRRGRGRLRPAADRRGEREASRRARRGREAPGRDHHDRPDPRPARAPR